MGTKYELLEKLDAAAQVQNMTIRVAAIGIAIDREQTTAVYDSDGNVIPGQKGENAIQNFVSATGIPVYAVAGIREVVDYLFQEKTPVMIQGEKRPIDTGKKEEFDEYLEIYGTIS
jgi:orotate phosphoribosyltransferase